MAGVVGRTFDAANAPARSQRSCHYPPRCNKKIRQGPLSTRAGRRGALINTGHGPPPPRAGSHGSIAAIERRVRSANEYPSFATSQNTGTVVSPSPETFVRTAVYCC
jgi:hypothetical protein